jgi:hypothetical protein
MIENNEQLKTALATSDEFELSADDLKIAFANLVSSLMKNHTLSRPLSVPKSDDYTVHMGRHGSVQEAIAHACKVDFHTLDSFASGSNISNGVFVDKVYLEILLSESANKTLVDAINRVKVD